MSDPTESGSSDSSPPPDYQHLWKQIQNRQESALKKLIDYHIGTIEFIITKILNYSNYTAQDIEEIVSSVFLAVWNDVEKYDPQRASFATWINMRAKYAALDFKRKLANLPTELALADNFRLNIDNQLRKQEKHLITALDNKQFVEKMKQNLNEEEQYLLNLRYFEEKKLSEIAKITDRPLGTIKSKLSKLHKSLGIIYKHEYLSMNGNSSRATSNQHQKKQKKAGPQ